MKKHNEGHSATCVCKSSMKATAARYGGINVQIFSTVFTEVFTVSYLVSHWLTRCIRQIQLSKVFFAVLIFHKTTETFDGVDHEYQANCVQANHATFHLEKLGCWQYAELRKFEYWLLVSSAQLKLR